ncbi:MAG: hypothetical protein E7Z89_03000 [Cyanobacteria bacterium SIG28]|nr:hypothetical protein [Cyanobacteria bacterium SIG28]
MLKRTIFFISVAIFMQNLLTVNANSTIYTDDIGRMHFMGKMGGYNEIKQTKNNILYDKTVNEAVDKYSQKENIVKDSVKNTEQDITSVIKERTDVPTSNYKSSFSFEKGKMDASNHYGIGGTNIQSGVNDSKTIYKDEIGRLHFFGKANQIRE